MITTMPPQQRSPGAIPVLLYGQLSGIRTRHDVTIVTLAGPDEAELEAVEQLRRSGLEVHAVERSQVAGLRGWVRLGSMAAAWLFSAVPKRTIWYRESRMQSAIDRVLADRRFDLIQVENLAAGVYRLPSTIPKLLAHHEVLRGRPIDWTAWRRPRPVRSVVDEFDWHRWAGHQASVLRRFDRVQVFSHRDAASIVGIAPDVAPRVRVNPFCLEIPPAADHRRERPGTVVYVGSFLHPPNVDAAVWLVEDIMPRLRVLFPGVRLTIVGADPRGRIRQLPRDDVRLTGFVPDLDPLLEEAAVVVAPVRIGGGQRMKVLYAMAAGKAVVTTTRGAEGLDAPGTASALHIEDDADGIARAVASLLHSPSLRHEIGRRGRALVEEHYAPHAYARRAEAIYDELRRNAA